VIRNILVPFDNSKFAKKSFVYAKEMAEKLDATIFLLTVIDEYEYLHGALLAELVDGYTVKDTIRKYIKSVIINEKKNLKKL